MSEISNSSRTVLQVDLTTLSLQKLTMLKQELDQEINIFQVSLEKLRIAQSKFQESGACLDKVTPAREGNEILVPLTGSMYVVGKLADTNNVLVDIGTGYYAQKSIPDAKDYFDRSVSYIKEQMDRIQQLTIDRCKVRDAAIDEIEMKLQSQMQKENARRA